MDTQPTQENRPGNPRRRKKTKAQIFRERYLPFLIFVAGVLVVVAIIVGIVVAIGHASNHETTMDPLQEQLSKQASSLLKQANALADEYDYDAALELLNSFEGDPADFPKIQEAIDAFTIAKANLVTWTAEDVTNLSFHPLIADLSAALADTENGTAYNRNFITAEEFSDILSQLYNGGYVLVDLDDLYEYDEQNQTYVEKELLLPAEKKPIMLTLTHCTYYDYMASSHAFPTRLCYSEKKGFYSELTTASGSTKTGNYDFVSILEAFLSKKSDFSYRGARAILAFSGYSTYSSAGGDPYDSVFGYITASTTLSEEELAQQREQATELMTRLRETGYTVACYSYYNANYSSQKASYIKEDIRLWKANIAPIVGETDIMVFARESDIGTSYEDNEKFDVLYNAGFRYFLGSAPIRSNEVSATFVRHSRMMVTATNLCYNSTYFEDIIDTAGLLDKNRGTIPQ